MKCLFIGAKTCSSQKEFHFSKSFTAKILELLWLTSRKTPVQLTMWYSSGRCLVILRNQQILSARQSLNSPSTEFDMLITTKYTSHHTLSFNHRMRRRISMAQTAFWRSNNRKHTYQRPRKALRRYQTILFVRAHVACVTSSFRWCTVIDLKTRKAIKQLQYGRCY